MARRSYSLSATSLEPFVGGDARIAQISNGTARKITKKSASDMSHASTLMAGPPMPILNRSLCSVAPQTPITEESYRRFWHA